MAAKLSKRQRKFFTDRANVTTMDRMFPFSYSASDLMLDQMVWNLDRKGFVVREFVSNSDEVRVKLTDLGRELYYQNLL
jgi:hypothetical protein